MTVHAKAKYTKYVQKPKRYLSKYPDVIGRFIFKTERNRSHDQRIVFWVKTTSCSQLTSKASKHASEQDEIANRQVICLPSYLR